MDSLVVELKADISGLSSGMREATQKISTFKLAGDKQGKIRFSTNLSDLQSGIDQAQDAIQSLSKNTSRSRVLDVRADVHALMGQLQAAEADAARFGNRADQKALVHVRAEIKSLQGQLANAGAEIDKFSRQAEANTGRFTRALGSAKAAVAGLGLVAATYATVEFGKSVVQAGMDMQALTNRMKAAAGSAEGGAEALAFVRAEAERLGLDLKATADGFAGFMASATRAGLTMQQTKEIFTGVSEAATSLHLSNERVGLIFKALEQMAAKGTVQMQELKGQLGDSLPGAFEIAAQAMGVTTQELGKMMEQGQVMSTDFLPKFAAAVKQQLGGSVEDASKSAQAAFNRMGNAWFELQAKMAQAGVLDGVTAAVENLTKALNDPATQEGLIAFARLLGDIAAAAAKAMAALGSFYNMTRQNKAALLTDDGLGGNAIDRIQRERSRQAAIQSMAGGTGAKPDASGGLLSGTGNTFGGLIQNAPLSTYNPKGAVGGDGRTFDASAGMSLGDLFGTAGDGVLSSNPEERLKALREQLQAEETVRGEFRAIRLTADQEMLTNISSAEETTAKQRQDLEQQVSDSIASMKQGLVDKSIALAQLFAGKNKTIALAMLAFEKGVAIARSIMETHVAAAAALKYDPTGALSAYVTKLGYANVALIAATGITEAAMMGKTSKAGPASYANSPKATKASTTTADTTAGTSNIVINLQGSDTANFTKTQVRDLISAINDASKDGSRLNVVAMN